jgi:hypothetical protein
VRAELVETTVDVLELVLEPVHPARDTFEPRGHAVEAAVELGEGLGELVDDALDGAGQAGERVVLRFEPRHGLVEALGEHTDLGAVRHLRQPLADRAEGVDGGQAGVDVVECVEDLLLFALTHFGRAHQHVAHPVEGRGCNVVVSGHCGVLRGGEMGGT